MKVGQIKIEQKVLKIGDTFKQYNYNKDRTDMFTVTGFGIDENKLTYINAIRHNFSTGQLEDNIYQRVYINDIQIQEK